MAFALLTSQYFAFTDPYLARGLTHLTFYPLMSPTNTHTTRNAIRMIYILLYSSPSLDSGYGITLVIFLSVVFLLTK